jgi:NADPH:quinone reductase-like Zn-dependent oxidoreductase
MKAIVATGYGPPDEVLEIRRLSPPVVGDDEVLVSVHAAGIHAGDWLQLSGRPYVFRLSTGLPKPRPKPLGHDIAGRVEAVGKEITAFEPGDRVFGECPGALAELAAVKAARIAQLPDGISFEQAAAVPVSAATALQGLRDHAKVRPGQKVLINGASGGVGTFAVQIGKILGARVTGVCSTTKVDLVRSLGADHVIDYTQEDFTAGEERYDVILDNAGNHSLRALRGALGPRGVLLPSNGTSGGSWFGPLWRIAGAALMSPLSRKKNRIFVGLANTEDLDLLATYILDGAVNPVVEATYPFSEAGAAFERLGTGHARGKLVIKVRE